MPFAATPYFGDFPLGAIVRIPWTSDDYDWTPLATTGLTLSDIRIYKNGGLTQRASTSGITLVEGFDGMLAQNYIEVDMSDDSDPGFYSAGSEIMLAVYGCSVGATATEFWAGAWSCVRLDGILQLVQDIPNSLEFVTLLSAFGSRITPINQVLPALIKQLDGYPLPIYMRDADGLGVAGLTLAISTMKADATAFTLIAPTVVDAGYGFYKATMTAAMLDTVPIMAVHVEAAGAQDNNFTVEVRPQVLGDTLDANVATVGLLTAAPSAAATSAGMVIFPDSIADKATVDDILTAVVAIGLDVTSILLKVGTTGVVLTAAAIDAIWDEVMEGAYTARQYMRGFASALLGILSGAATTTVTIRDTADTKNRIVATVDASGNRSAVTRDLT